MHSSEYKSKAADAKADAMSASLKTGDNCYFLAAVVDASHDAIVGWTLDGEIVSWNKGAEIMYGFSAEEVRGLKFPEVLIPPHLIPKAKEIFRRVEQGEIIRNYEAVRRTKDGRDLLISLTLSPIKDSKSETIGVSTVGRDVTAYKETERNLRFYADKVEQQKKDIEAIIENLPVGVFLINASTGEPFLINQFGQKMLGRSLGSWGIKDRRSNFYDVKREDGTVYPPEELPVNITMKTGELVMKSGIFIHKPDGTKTALRVTSAPIKNAKGVMHSVVAVFEDVTREFAIDRAKSEFVSLVSHQLRTPLTAINIFTEMLEGGDAGELQPEQKEYVRDIHESTQRMIRLVNDLLNLSRIETGSLNIQAQALDIEEFIAGILKDVEPLTEAKGIRVAFRKPAEKLAKIAIDPNLLRQVVYNLVANAIRYSPKKESTVEVSLVKDSNDFYLLSVKDEGIGIPRAAQERIFEKFFRADNASNLVSDGTGLGLYASRAIIETLGGRIWFESEEGKGTAFYIVVPAKAAGKERKGVRDYLSILGLL